MNKTDERQKGLPRADDIVPARIVGYKRVNGRKLPELMRTDNPPWVKPL